ncbi:MAG: hypothetical protein A3F12_00405 [Gammaproteobacteria bacterium RIFCSPHIGHO2_12_FULL_38_14]|nr:MAG: hypothetical protein A3F12_00405 [Gammaproteobacteria bacterium RIFCSPHIGHO2_12_FULL_38_14]
MCAEHTHKMQQPPDVAVEIIQQTTKIRLYTIVETKMCTGYTMQITVQNLSEKQKQIFFDALDTMLPQEMRGKSHRFGNTYAVTFPHNKEAPYQKMEEFCQALEPKTIVKNSGDPDKQEAQLLQQKTHNAMASKIENQKDVDSPTQASPRLAGG